VVELGTAADVETDADAWGKGAGAGADETRVKRRKAMNNVRSEIVAIAK
jgi:hypothetical protein